MSKQLHLLRRLEDERPDPLGSDVLALAAEHEIRVLEFFDAATHVAALDLTLSERDMPELVATMHWAEEVHAHHISPEAILATMPYVRPAVLKDTVLVMHGPWAVPTRPVRRAGTRLQQWPGPVRVHRSPPDAKSIAPMAQVVELAPVLDRGRSSLLPRSCGPIPMQLDDGRRLAVIGIGADVPEEQRTALRHILPSVSAGQVALEVVDETQIPVAERDEVRRAMQAYIVPGLESGAWSRWLLEAVAQGVPIISLGEPIDGAPPDVAFTRSGDDVDRVAALVRSWCGAWANGNAAPLDRAGRRDWLDALGVR